MGSKTWETMDKNTLFVISPVLCCVFCCGKDRIACKTKRKYMRNWLNSSCRSLLVRRSFVLKVARNYGKRYGELPKAIPCNILKCNQFIHGWL